MSPDPCEDHEMFYLPGWEMLGEVHGRKLLRAILSPKSSQKGLRHRLVLSWWLLLRKGPSSWRAVQISTHIIQPELGGRGVKNLQLALVLEPV